MWRESIREFWFLKIANLASATKYKFDPTHIAAEVYFDKEE
jgi:hypothetical protein